MTEKYEEYQTVEAWDTQRGLKLADLVEKDLGIKLPQKLRLAFALLPRASQNEFYAAYEQASVLLSELAPVPAQSSETAQGDKSAE